MVDSLLVFAPRPSGRAVKNASLFDSGRGNISRRKKERGLFDCPRSDFSYCRAFFGSSLCF
ncbi:hypothetical protein [Ruminococcus albus]|uniref:hypothetical protein n=1 Tax=Ruminococcus albus TaxID=1264 RepID=UPI001A9A5045|nr:hypothetical protein [Ruminococcus albus]